MPEFYNEADYSDYPFIAGYDREHDGGLFDGKGFLDFQVTIGPDTPFSEATNTVALTSFNVGVADVIFIFSIEGVGLINFTVPLNSAYGFAKTSELVLATKVVATGVLVTGNLGYFTALPIGTHTFVTPAVVEPTLVTSLRGAFVTEVIAANSPRRRPLDCCETDPGTPPSVPPIFTVESFPITGDVVKFKEGFNCYITLSLNDDSVTIGSRVGAGEGAYDGVPILIDNWSFQTDPPYKCNDFVSSINGIESSNNVLRMLAGAGLQIESDQPNNKLIITNNNRAVKCEPEPETP